MATRKRGGRRALLVVLALLLMLLPCAEAQVAGAATETPAWEGTCMANCSKPLFNELFSPTRVRSALHSAAALRQVLPSRASHVGAWLCQVQRAPSSAAHAGLAPRVDPAATYQGSLTEFVSKGICMEKLAGQLPGTKPPLS